ncbi:MAG: YopX family protein [Porphyromonas sp.]|nr:YopX family protein [Porphyromonas sp.]
MNEIKFRAKTVMDGEWCYGYLVYSDETLPKIVRIDRGICRIDDVDDNTIGQYTGLKDKQGNEIYEGDILRPFDFTHIDKLVVWNSEEARFSVENINWSDYGYMQLSQSYINEFDFWVVGNMHDNPELIKNKNEDKEQDVRK